ncbi:MAG: hypothetical protein AAF490_17985 [Chloroflexota bacterium]
MRLITLILAAPTIQFMPKRRKPEKRPFSLPDEYSFLIPILDEFQADEASLNGKQFLALPQPRQQHYFAVKKQLIELPIESALKLSTLYKQYPVKKYAETQRIHLFFSQLSQWQEAPVLDNLPKALSYLAKPARDYDLWDEAGVDSFFHEAATEADKVDLENLASRFTAHQHSSLATQFLEKHPPFFFHEAMLLKNLLAILDLIRKSGQ